MNIRNLFVVLIAVGGLFCTGLVVRSVMAGNHETKVSILKTMSKDEIQKASDQLASSNVTLRIDELTFDSNGMIQRIAGKARCQYFGPSVTFSSDSLRRGIMIKRDGSTLSVAVD